MRVEIHRVDAGEVSDRLQRPFAMRTRGHLAFLSRHRLKRMENNLLQELAKGEALELGQGLEHLDHAALHPNADLRAINGWTTLRGCWDHGTNVPWDRSSSRSRWQTRTP